MGIIRRTKAWLVLRYGRKLIERLPAEQKEIVMEFLKGWWGSRAQWARVIVAVAGVATAGGWVPDFVPLFHRIAEALQGGDSVALVGVLFLIVQQVTGFFDRIRKDKQAAAAAVKA